MIGIVNYHAGNASSVAAALDAVGVTHRMIDNPDHLADLGGVVLPGVGSADATMASLRDLDLLDALTRFAVDEGRPFLGICVGLQIIFEHSDEGDCPCLGWLKGTVHRFDDDKARVPQIGWNVLDIAQPDHPMVAGVPADSYCYFVNSYHAVPANAGDVVARTDYAGPSTAIVASGNIWASQFHTEKSGPVGLRMLKNFAEHAASLASGAAIPEASQC